MNKTESRVELRWSPNETACLSESQKRIVIARLAKRLTEDGTLIFTSLLPVKKRKPTRPSRSSVEKRIRSKKIRGELKRSRGIRPDE